MLNFNDQIKGEREFRVKFFAFPRSVVDYFSKYEVDRECSLTLTVKGEPKMSKLPPYLMLIL